MAIAAAGCSRTSTSDIDSALDTAREAVADGDIATAGAICDSQLADSASLSAESLVRLAVVYMKIADSHDHPDNSDDIAAAINCYRMACQRDTSVTKGELSDFSAEDYSYLMVLGNLTHSLDTDASRKTEERDFVTSPDSIT